MDPGDFLKKILFVLKVSGFGTFAAYTWLNVSKQEAGRQPGTSFRNPDASEEK